MHVYISQAVIKPKKRQCSQCIPCLWFCRILHNIDLKILQNVNCTFDVSVGRKEPVTSVTALCYFLQFPANYFIVKLNNRDKKKVLKFITFNSWILSVQSSLAIIGTAAHKTCVTFPTFSRNVLRASSTLTFSLCGCQQSVYYRM